jgi:hypothetical protein
MDGFDTLQAPLLTAAAADVQARAMTRTLILMVAAAAALAGCNKESHTIVQGGGPADDQPINMAAANSVELPPSIAASKIYRCHDNSVIYVDWLSDNKSANVRTDKTGAATPIDTSAEGAKLKGSATASTITYNGQSCKA